MSQTLTFKLGNNIGEVLLGIAQEKIQKGQPEESVKVYETAFCGMTKDYAIKILKNQLVVEVDDDGTGINLTDDNISRIDNNINIIDWNSELARWLKNLNDIRDTRINIMNKFNRISPTYDIEDLSLMDVREKYNDYDNGLIHIAAKLIAGHGFAQKLSSNGEDTWNRVEERVLNGRGNVYEELLYWVVEYNKIIKLLLNEYIRFAGSYHWLIDNGWELEHKPFLENIIESVLIVLNDYSDDNKGYYHPMCDEEVHDFKEYITDELMKTHFGNEYLKYKIIKNNIEDGYDAGWLSPTGEFYGGLGPTSNMIHLTLAEKLKSITNMPQHERVPEAWLERNGWLKIHHDSIYGFFSDKYEDETYCPTEAQLKEICKYVEKHYGGKFYTEYATFDVRTFRPNPIKTSDLKQMDRVKLHQIFSF